MLHPLGTISIYLFKRFGQNWTQYLRCGPYNGILVLSAFLSVFFLIQPVTSCLPFWPPPHLEQMISLSSQKLCIGLFLKIIFFLSESLSLNKVPLAMWVWRGWTQIFHVKKFSPYLFKEKATFLRTWLGLVWKKRKMVF